MFIESVRARATCNTIISSHPVSSHRPCTSGQLFPCPSDFFLPVSRLLSPLLSFPRPFFPPPRYFPTLSRYGSSRRVSSLLLRSQFPAFPRVLSIFPPFLYRFLCVRMYTSTCVRFHATLSPSLAASLHLIPRLHDVHSILSHLLQVTQDLAAPVPFFSSTSHPRFVSAAGKEREIESVVGQSRLPVSFLYRAPFGNRYSL